jgi:hypothetical protein
MAREAKMTSADATPTQARYRWVLAWRAQRLTYREIGHRLGVSEQRAQELVSQARRWQQSAALEALPISAQARGALWRAGVRTVSEVAVLSDAALLNLPGIGRGTVAALRAAVTALAEADGAESE